MKYLDRITVLLGCGLAGAAIGASSTPPMASGQWWSGWILAVLCLVGHSVWRVGKKEQ